MQRKSTLLREIYARSHFERPENAIGFWMWRAAHQYQRVFDRAMEPLQLTHLQFVILAVCGWITEVKTDPAPGATQREIAEVASVHFAQVSAVLKTLEQKKLIVQRRDKDDTRRRSVTLTFAGVKKVAEAVPIARSLQQRLFGPMEEQKRTRSFLENIVKTLEDAAELEPGP